MKDNHRIWEDIEKVDEWAALAWDLGRVHLPSVRYARPPRERDPLFPEEMSKLWLSPDQGEVELWS